MHSNNPAASSPQFKIKYLVVPTIGFCIIAIFAPPSFIAE